jgi:hypothetical protein
MAIAGEGGAKGTSKFETKKSKSSNILR